MSDLSQWVPPVSLTPHNFDGLKGCRLSLLGSGTLTTSVVSAFLQIEGTKVTIGRRGQQGLDADLAAIREGIPDADSRVFGQCVDSGDSDSVNVFTNYSSAVMGGINLALFGVGSIPKGANLQQGEGIDKLDPAAIVQQYNTDVVGMIRFAQALESHLRSSVEARNRQARFAAILSIGPDCADSSWGYNMAKRATAQAVENLADQWAPWCGVNGIMPGVIPTPLNAARIAPDKPRGRGVSAFTIAGRLGVPIDVAQAFLFVLNPDNAWMIGAKIPVDGGISVAKKYGGPLARRMLQEQQQ